MPFGERGVMGGRRPVGRRSLYNVNPYSLGISWFASYWANDPSWTNPGDGNGVSSWRDASGNSRTMVQATGASQPTFRLASTAYSNRSTIDFSAGSRYLTWADATSRAQPWSYVVVGNTQGGGAQEVYIDAETGAQIEFASDSTQLLGYAGGATQTFTGATDTWTNPHMLISYYGNGAATSKIIVDGNVRTSGVTLGGNAITGFKIGALVSNNASFFLLGKIAFVGIYAGDITAHASYTALKGWFGAYYGLSVV